MKSFLTKLAEWAFARTHGGREAVECARLSPYLERVGWFKSVEARLPVDREENCLPWFTYSSIFFLEERIQPNMRVFEYGSGNSTLWWSKRVAHVTSCEHDPEWYGALTSKIPSNVEYLHEALDPEGRYSEVILDFSDDFDVIVVDGRNRIQCAINSLKALKREGVIIWDNSDRSRYDEGYAFLIRNGFMRLDFKGLGPINGYEWCTSIFYRAGNCLGI